MSKTPERAQLYPMLEVLAPTAVGGIVLMILLLKFIAKLNGREFTWQSIRAPKKGTENVKPINVWVILGWIFCLVFACLDLIGG